jgi:hypothetical protein
MNSATLRIGTRVERVDNPRHVGTVVAVLWSRTIRVQWDNGWREDVEADEIARCNSSGT